VLATGLAKGRLGLPEEESFEGRGLSHCASCGSARLVRMLGHTQCKDCGAEDSVIPEGAPAPASAPGEAEPTPPAPPSSPPSPPSPASKLADDVRAALERQFGRDSR